MAGVLGGSPAERFAVTGLKKITKQAGRRQN